LARATRTLGAKALALWSFARLHESLSTPLHVSNVILGPVTVEGTANIRIGRNARIYPGVVLETQGAGRIVVGDNVVLSRGVHIVAFDAVTLGDDCMVGEYASLRPHLAGQQRLDRARGLHSEGRVHRFQQHRWCQRGGHPQCRCRILRTGCSRPHPCAFISRLRIVLMSSHCVPMAYLVSRYPAISHTFILREIAHLRSLGHQIFTASINAPDRDLEAMDATERTEAEQTYGVKQHGIGGAFSALCYWALRAPFALLKMLAASRRFGLGRGLAYAVEATMVARWMQRHAVSHLHVHFGNAGASVGVLVKQLTGCHLSYTIHGPDEFDDVPGQQLAFKMHAADVIVCISQFARSQLMRISSPTDWPKFKVVRLGVDASVFQATPRTANSTVPQLVSVGRLTPAKGQVLLVQACAQLRDKGVDFHLTMVGDGPDRSRVEAEIAKHQLASHISLTGSLTQEGVRAALARSDAFVLPSLAEGIPVVLMEAMASYVPCISTPVNGIPELIEHGNTGLLATPGDVDSLVTQLTLMCTRADLRHSMALHGYTKVTSQFDLLSNVRALGGVFSQFSKA
jgi:glycosyltransferase involved in cell wall biosynthesis